MINRKIYTFSFSSCSSTECSLDMRSSKKKYTEAGAQENDTVITSLMTHFEIKGIKLGFDELLSATEMTAAEIKSISVQLI